MVEELSQDEIDALLSSLISKGDDDFELTEAEKIAAEGKPFEAKIREKKHAVFDFKKIEDTKLSSIKIALHSILTYWYSFFTLIVREKINLELIKIEKITSVESFDDDLVISATNFFDNSAFLIFDKQLALNLIGVLLGNKNKNLLDTDFHHFSHIEISLLKKVFQSLFRYFYLGLNLGYQETSHALYDLSAIKGFFQEIPDACVATFHLNTSIFSGKIKLLISLEDLLQISSNSLININKKESIIPISKEHADLIKEQIKETKVDISFHLAETNIPVKSIFNLKKGDIVKFSDTSVADPIKVLISNKSKFLAKKNYSNKKTYFKILSKID
ncbi:MAG: FliM/FliN family flagellar motor switch protein [Candidatus Margulisiibacteriota bacterium]|jgi:flagellar motor switch protein FliM